ncbi:MAG: hypothetical protein QW734_05470 [Candidatus Bathyarchaeia archaeon]
MNRTSYIIAIALLVLPVLLIGKSEIITGEYSAYYEGIVRFTVSKYIEVDFGSGWITIYAMESFSPGETKTVILDYSPGSTYINVTENTNINVNIAIGIPDQGYIEMLGIDNAQFYRNSYSDLVSDITPPYYYVPESMIATISVPPRISSGTKSSTFIICVYDSEIQYYDACPAL